MSSHGLPCWYELATNNVDTAKAFYSAVLGWTWADSGMPGMAYLLAKADGAMVAGLFSADPGIPLAWTQYVAVDDADALVAQAKALGATVVVPPTDIPNTGRFAVLIDPQGASFAILQPLPDGTGGAFDQSKPGHGNWHDLACPDASEALACYGALFGWTEARAMPMGPSMTYHVIARGDLQFGGIIAEAGQQGPAKWTVYFGTRSIHTAVDLVKSAGGHVQRDPAEVPGGALIIHCTDPNGAVFALVGRA